MITASLIVIITLWLEASNSQLVPFVNCTVNTPLGCTTVWGYRNDYATLQILPLFRNKFTPSPTYRGQPTVFQPNTIDYRAFNTTTPCSVGNLTWTLIDPFTDQSITAISDTTLGDSCTTVTVDCSDNIVVADRLSECQAECTQCPYCSQVYAYCEQIEFIATNFTLENCLLINLGFNRVSDGCNYETVLNDCCENVGPPVLVPSAVPVPLPTPLASCPPVNVSTCSSSFDCPKYYYCDSRTCKGIQGTRCGEDATLTCLSSDCSDSPDCQCEPLVSVCSDADCGCNGQRCSESGCIPNLHLCTSSADCSFSAPFCVNGYCVDYTCTAPQCSDVQIPFCCDDPLVCPQGTVCDAPGSYCTSTIDGPCFTDGDCNSVYECSSATCTCIYAAPDAFQEALIPTCSSSFDPPPFIPCNETVSVALSTRVTNPNSFECDSQTVVQDYPIAYFRLPVIPGATGQLRIDWILDNPFVNPRVASYIFCFSNPQCTFNAPFPPFVGTYSLNDANRGFLLYYPEFSFLNSYGAIYNITLTCT